MGLGVTDSVDDGGGCGGGKEEPVVAVSCSICLDAVTDNGERAWAKLQCGHQFHLDCIGSAFNVKGAMQCPNCRKVEKGQWLYGNGSRPVPEFTMEDWAHDEELYDYGYSELSAVGVQWCPYAPSTYDEGEFPSNSFHDLLGHNPFFAEHTPVSSTSHPCPYIAYIGPMHPSSSTSNGSVSDGSSFNHWRGQGVTNEGPSSYTFPTMDVPYNGWFAVSSRSDQPSVQPVTQRTARSSSEISRHGMHPYTFGHSSASRAPSSITSTMPPPFANSQTRHRERTPLQAYFHQSASNPPPRTVIMSGRRSRNSSTVTPVAPPFDQSSGIYFVSSSSSGRTYQEPEIPLRGRFSREREHQPSYPVSQVDRDSSIWGPFNPPGSGIFSQRHGSSQNRS